MNQSLLEYAKDIDWRMASLPSPKSSNIEKNMTLTS
jgi:hypothetical protein